jgi:hypothetical protein
VVHPTSKRNKGRPHVPAAALTSLRKNKENSGLLYRRQNSSSRNESGKRQAPARMYRNGVNVPEASMAAIAT